MCQEQYGFAAKMRNQAVEQLKALETWVERQATGLDMAANPESLRQSFDKLLKVLSHHNSCNATSCCLLVSTPSPPLSSSQFGAGAAGDGLFISSQSEKE